MPKISAPTVAEHRRLQRSALIGAAEQILLTDGLAAITARSVSEAAGMTRSSFYDYFPSKDDLLVAITIEAIDRWDDEVNLALDGVDQGPATLRCYVATTLQMIADGKHRLAQVLRDADLAPSRMDDLRIVHDKLMAPVIEVLTDSGVRDPVSHGYLVQGLIGAGVQLVAHGADAEQTAADITAILERGLPL